MALVGALTLSLVAVVAAQDSTANVEVRVWQSTREAESLYISARPEGGNWNTLGTIPLDMSGLNSRETFRYGDITVSVPVGGPADLTIDESEACTLLQDRAENTYLYDLLHGYRRSPGGGSGTRRRVRDIRPELPWRTGVDTSHLSPASERLLRLQRHRPPPARDQPPPLLRRQRQAARGHQRRRTRRRRPRPARSRQPGATRPSQPQRRPQPQSGRTGRRLRRPCRRGRQGWSWPQPHLRSKRRVPSPRWTRGWSTPGRTATGPGA